jgi:hypothetical protein
MKCTQINTEHQKSERFMKIAFFSSSVGGLFHLLWKALCCALAGAV